MKRFAPLCLLLLAAYPVCGAETCDSVALPRFAGVSDPLRAVRLLPGVQTAVDGNSGLYIRGNDAGRSSVLLNDAPLYAPYHLFGLFSTLDPGHVGSIELDKSGMGATAGISPGAALRVRTAEEVPERPGVEGEVGIIAAQATTALPLGRNRKGALYLSGRRSYAEWLVALLGASDDLKYTFQDYDATIIWEPTPAHKLIVNGHYGDDRLRTHLDRYDLSSRIRGHGSTSSARLESRLTEQLTLEQTLYLSDFANRLDLGITGISIALPSSLVDVGYKNALGWHRGICDLRAGVAYAFRRLRPQYPESDRSAENPLYRTHEVAPYVAADIAAHERISVELALRYALYVMRHRDTGERYTHTSPEPGLTIEYRPATHHRLRAVYTYGAQFIALVPASDACFSTDFWMPATAAHPPMTCHDVTLSYHAALLDRRLQLSAETYYRRMRRLVECDLPLPGLLLRPSQLESRIYSGDGEAYGVELTAAYTSRRLHGRVSYTLGRAVRRFAELNDGRPFPARQDRRHDLALALVWSPTPRWDASAVFVCSSGAPYTAPTSYRVEGGLSTRDSEAYNGSRLPVYHRLDLSVTRWLGRRDDNRHNGINLSISNCYSRRNPFFSAWSVWFQEEGIQSPVSRLERYLYGVIPSLSWIFRF